MPKAVHRQIHPVARDTLKRLAVAGLVYWLPVVLFSALAEDVAERSTTRFDSGFLQWLHGASSPALDWFFLHATSFGGFAVIFVLTVLTAAILSLRGHYRNAIFVLAGVGGAVVINTFLKLLFHRSRPQLWHQIVNEPGFSFPSGHAMMSSALALTFIVLCWKTRAKWPVLAVASVYIAAVGLSRLYLGVHFPTDILAGWCVSFAWIMLVGKILRVGPFALY